MASIVKDNGLIAVKQFIDCYKRPLVPGFNAPLQGAAREAGGKWRT